MPYLFRGHWELDEVWRVHLYETSWLSGCTDLTLSFHCCFLYQVEYPINPQDVRFHILALQKNRVNRKKWKRAIFFFPMNRNRIRKTQCQLWKNNIRKHLRFWTFLGYILNARAEGLPVLSEQEEMGVAKKAVNWRAHLHTVHADASMSQELYITFPSHRELRAKPPKCVGLTE